MPNPYTYNRGIDDAIRKIAELSAGQSDEVIALLVKVICGVAGLKRQERHRRTRAEMAAAQQKSTSGAFQ